MNELEKAALSAAHDRCEWMDFAGGRAWIHDEATYVAELRDGTTRDVVAEIYSAEESYLRPAVEGEPDVDNSQIARLRWLGY
ncbi:hypothetical protein [Nitrospirillum amazonense]|uniref:hypothetical protein n=1 Tax=Nitrospirillum amazonense TaxID=28077 RepID=UPI002412E166|nr:hypothetical protein [Nitrospirillum amazonense]MDG3444598.1 hypothetical protein [Nitrospirillum amazonense]